MLSHLFKRFGGRRSGANRGQKIDPDEIFLDARNLPQFDRHQFEGRLERAIPRRTIISTGVAFALCLLLILSRAFALQVEEGGGYAKQSEQNRLRHTLIFGSRGVFYDRTGTLLAWNVADSEEAEFAKRRYFDGQGLAHILGFLKYPSRDAAGFFYKVDFEGHDGVERFFSEYVAPHHGMKIVETGAYGQVTSESVLRPPRDGANATLTIDARLQEALYTLIGSIAAEKKFQGGAAVMMDVETGEVVALVSFPEYDSQVLTDGEDAEAIKRAFTDSKTPFLNRATYGLYTPGSIVKIFVALAALEERIITPEKEIVSTGSLVVPNPFNPERPSVFRDWKAHGAVDMREALAVSSDVYFYEVGGGFEDQQGLGIEKIEKYMRLFGFGEVPPGNDFWGVPGVIPNPEWKQEHFDGEGWRLGDTYLTAIGQYGFQVTPIQTARAVAAIANGGKLLEPRLILEKNTPPAYEIIPISTDSFAVVKEGMREAVRAGTASGLSLPFISVGAKTGTAELGVMKQTVNSWVVGFFPFEKPRYAFAIIMERGPHENTVGAAFVMREFLEWMHTNTPEYLADSAASDMQVKE